MTPFLGGTVPKRDPLLGRLSPAEGDLAIGSRSAVDLPQHSKLKKFNIDTVCGLLQAIPFWESD